MNTQIATRRMVSPERWRAAADRAALEGVEVFQIVGSGQWVATSGTRTGIAYGLAVTGNIAHGCDCPAGQHEDDCCKHRAAFFRHIGALAVVERQNCPDCSGGGYLWYRSGYTEPCGACGGSGTVDAQSA